MAYDEEIQSAAPVRDAADVEALPKETASVFVHDLDDVKAIALRRFEQLRVLVQNGNSKITDDGLVYLSGIKSLEFVDLEWSLGISDRGLHALTSLPSLKWLDVSFCPGISEEAIEAFQRARPGCEVERHGQ